jgi:hypothetical protein
VQQWQAFECGVGHAECAQQQLFAVGGADDLFEVDSAAAGIDGYDRFNNLVPSIWARALARAEKIDMAKAHQVAKDPFVTKYLRGVATGLLAGFVQTGKLVSTVSSVTTAGDTATIKTCLDQSHMKLIDMGNPCGPGTAAS